MDQIKELKKYFYEQTFNGEKRPKEVIDKIFKKLESSNCVMCDRSKEFIGIYIPNKLYDGKKRHIPYPVCKKCTQDKSFMDKFEKLMEYDGLI